LNSCTAGNHVVVVHRNRVVVAVHHWQCGG
jgi:hypothetical protein